MSTIFVEDGKALFMEILEHLGEMNSLGPVLYILNQHREPVKLLKDCSVNRKHANCKDVNH